MTARRPAPPSVLPAVTLECKRSEREDKQWCGERPLGAQPQDQGEAHAPPFPGHPGGVDGQSAGPIASGCEPASRTAVPEKNYALAVELDKLLHGDQGVLPFLDNRGSILSLDTVEEVLRFSPPEVDRESDTRWSRENRDAIVRATRNLYFRLHPGGQFSDEKILEDITEWAFQVLPPADVPETESEVSELSLVHDEIRDSFIEMCDNGEQQIPTTSEGDTHGQETEGGVAQQQSSRFETEGMDERGWIEGFRSARRTMTSIPHSYWESLHG